MLLLTIRLTYISRKKGSCATLFKSSFPLKRGIFRFREYRRLVAIIPFPRRPALGIVFTASRYHLHPRKKRMHFVSPGTCENARVDLPMHFGVTPTHRYTRYWIRMFVCVCYWAFYNERVTDEQFKRDPVWTWNAKDVRTLITMLQSYHYKWYSILILTLSTI